jgi:hypothetical protein
MTPQEAQTREYLITKIEYSELEGTWKEVPVTEAPSWNLSGKLGQTTTTYLDMKFVGRNWTLVKMYVVSSLLYHNSGFELHENKYSRECRFREIWHLQLQIPWDSTSHGICNMMHYQVLKIWQEERHSGTGA